MKFVLKQIRSDKSIKDSESLLTITIFTTSILGLYIYITLYLLKDLNIVLFLLGPLIYILFGRRLTRKLLLDWPTKKDTIGTLSFFDLYILSETDKFYKLFYDQMARMNLNYNYIKGSPFYYKDIIHNGLAELQIVLKNNETITIKLLIETENELNNFKEFLLILYRKKVKVSEYMGNERIITFLCDQKFLYKERLELMKQFNIQV